MANGRKRHSVQLWVKAHYSGKKMLSQIFLGFIIDNLTLILKMKCKVERGQCSLWKKKVFCNWPCYFNFWVVEDTCNLLYFYVVSANEQVAWVVELQLNYNSIKKSFKTTMQFHYNYTHDVVLTSSIKI